MSAALSYHNATKYHPDTINQHSGLDWDKQPVPFKKYHATEPVELAHLLPLEPSPFAAAPDAAAKFPDDANVGGGISLGTLSRWLYFSYGVTAVVANQPRPLYLRAAPSAGGLYPAECYIAVRSRAALEPGLYGFEPRKHQLIPLWLGEEISAALDEACYQNATVKAAPVAMIVSGVFERSAWRYQERAYRRILLDSGHMISNAAVTAPALGARTYVTGAFCDGLLNQLLRVDEEEEGALAVVTLNVPGAAKRPSWSALPSRPAEDNSDNGFRALHEASCLPEERPRALAHGGESAEDLEARYGYAGGVPIAIGLNPRLLESPLEIIARRRSTRSFRRKSVERDQFARILAYAYAKDLPHFDKSLLMTFVAVVAVDGIEPGVYYFAPHNQELRLLKAGCGRDELQYLCLGQELGGDAFAVVFQTIELRRAVERQGDRAYRYAHLDAGLLGERLNLAALAEDLGASGIGGFFDDHVNALLGIPEDQAVVYVTTLGVPETAG